MVGGAYWILVVFEIGSIGSIFPSRQLGGEKPRELDNGIIGLFTVVRGNCFSCFHMSLATTIHLYDAKSNA